MKMILKKIMPQNKKGAGGMLMVAMVITMLVVAGAVVYSITKQPVVQTQFPTEDKPGENLAASSIVAGCPDNRQSSIVVDVQNDQNTTGVETFDSTLELYDGAVTDPDSAPLEQLTDTSAGAATLTCGKRYMGKILSTSGASGDSGVIISASGSGLVDISVRDKKDAFFFTPTGESGKLVVKSQQHATQRVRVKDITQNAYMVDNEDATATDYETTDGIQFLSTTVGTNATAKAAGDTLSLRFEVQSVQTDTNLFDNGGMYILIDGTSSVWDVEKPSASASLEGTPLTLIKDPTDLTAAEKIAYTDYEIIYKVPYEVGKEITSNKDLFFDFELSALAGQDPATANNISVDFAPIGNFASISAPNILKIGAVDDTTARTDLHTRFDTLISIS